MVFLHGTAIMHASAAAAAIDGGVLSALGFPQGTVHFRSAEENYADVASRASADVLAEDDSA